MKYKSITALSFGALVLAGMVSCEDSTFIEGNALERVSYLYLNYCNPDTTGDANSLYGNKPTIALNEEMTSKDVIIDFSKTFAGKVSSSNTTEINIDNVRFFDDYGSYKIASVSVDEMRGDKWVPQSQRQNPVTYNDLKELDVAIVIDNSNYLDKQFNNLKSNAESFVRTISRRFPAAKFTVAFTSGDVTTISAMHLGSADEAVNAIKSKEKDQYSYMFTACNKAMEELNTGNSSSKVLVYFGAEDYSSIEDNSGIRTTVLESLTSGDYRNISVFAIGYSDDGLLSSKTLSSFCHTGRGFAIFPGNGDKLSEFFDYFSNSVAAAYTITYTHEATKFDTEQPIRFKFVLTQQR